MVRWHAAAMPGAAIVEAGVFAGFHPNGAEAGLCDARVSAEVGDWLLQAARHAVRTRANVVIGVADMDGMTGQCVGILEPAGYRVRCVEAAIPEPLRRLSELVSAQTVAGQWVAVSAVAGGAW
ncbi:hypothetical protein [Nocardia aobensis]|uniref:hypothetical protein n=1 Tax=Nocardia aobensis TaxID=257277 RepID=UPI0012F6E03C|nr:hypothetical protein [Nocardia aobensis]